MDGPAFLTYLREVLAPELAPGDLVTSPPIRSTSQRLSPPLEPPLPAYSPDLNPIEMALAKLKASLWPAAQRSFDGLVDALRQPLPFFSSSHCLHFFQPARYAAD